MAPADRVNKAPVHTGDGVAVILATDGESLTVMKGDVTRLLVHPAPGYVTTRL